MSDPAQLAVGSVKIHRRVLAAVVASALDSVSGVRLHAPGFSSALKSMMGIKHYPGINIILDKNHQVSIGVQVLMPYGSNIPELAQKTQTAIRDAVQQTVDMELKDIRINVQGITKKDS